MQITDEMVAVYGNKIRERVNLPAQSAQEMRSVNPHMFELMRSDLAAVAPLIRAAALEEAAKVVEELASYRNAPTWPARPIDIGRYEGEIAAFALIAERLRNLIATEAGAQKETGNG